MKSWFPVLLLPLLVVACTPTAPESTPQRWYKGNLHTHSFWSDGDDYPEMIMQWYRDHNYQFVGLTDHNILAEGEKWYRMPDASIYQEAFEKYVEAFGEEWVESREDSGRLEVKLKTLAEYRPRFEAPGEFLILQSEEITDAVDGKPIHINATNVQELIEPQGGETVQEAMQRNIDAVLAQREATGQPMFPHINHPNFHYAISLEEMIGLQGERFFEVYNGHPAVNNYGDSAHIGTEAMWDQINLAYAARGQALMYGLATDDSHNYHLMGPDYSNAGRGWVMVQADTLLPNTLVEALEAGAFYASTGVSLSAVERNGNELSLAVEAEPGVSYEIQFIGAKQGAGGTEILSTTSGTEARFLMTEGLVFVRAKVISSRLQENPFEEGDYESAWTQPVQF